MEFISHISKLNLIALLGLVIVLVGFGVFASIQPKPKADTIICNTNCAYIQVKMDGLVPEVADPTSYIASIMIIAPDGTTLAPGSSGSTGSKTFIAARNVFDSSFVPGTAKIGPFNPGNGYKVIIGDLNDKKGSWYTLVDPATATQTVNLIANQTTPINYTLALANGGELFIAVTFGDNSPNKYLSIQQKFADTVLTCGSQVFNGTVNYTANPAASALNGSRFTPPPGTCSLEIKNYDTARYKLTSANNPAKVVVTNRDMDIHYSFDVIPVTTPTTNNSSPSVVVATSPVAASPTPTSQATALAVTTPTTPEPSPSPSLNQKKTSKKVASPAAKTTPAPTQVATQPTPSPTASASPLVAKGPGLICRLSASCDPAAKVIISAIAKQPAHCFDRSKDCGLIGQLFARLTVRKQYIIDKNTAYSVVIVKPDASNPASPSYACVSGLKGNKNSGLLSFELPAIFSQTQQLPKNFSLKEATNNAALLASCVGN